MVLTHHACEPEPTAFLVGRSLAVTPEAFARQLDFVCANYRIVDLKDLEAGVIPERALPSLSTTA